jgi:hypothetical protein
MDNQNWLEASLFSDEENFAISEFSEVQIRALEAFSKTEDHEAEVFTLKIKENSATFNNLISNPVASFKGLSNWCKEIPEFSGDLVFLYKLGEAYQFGNHVSEPDKNRGWDLLRRAIELGYDGTAPKPWEAARHKAGR